MDTTPPPADTLSTSISNNSNENIGEVENKDTEMSHLEQDPSNCNNMNINKRARQNSGQRNPHAMSNIIHRNPEYGIVGANTVEIPIIRDHRMSVSDSGDSEPPRPSDLETEQATTAVEKNIPPSGSNVPETLESDGDVRSDEEDEDCSESQSVDCDFDDYYSFNDDDIDADLSRDRFSNYSGTGDGRLFNNNEDPEYFAYECLTVEKVEQLFSEQIATVCTACKISPSEAKMYLH